jgi:hypothetical protein
LVNVLFAFGALTYTSHPEGILEFQKRRWNERIERLLFRQETLAARAVSGHGPVAGYSDDVVPSRSRR